MQFEMTRWLVKRTCQPGFHLALRNVEEGKHGQPARRDAQGVVGARAAGQVGRHGDGTGTGSHLPFTRSGTGPLNFMACHQVRR